MAKEDERSLARTEIGKDPEITGSGFDISHTDLEAIQDPELDELIELLSQPTRALTRDERNANIARRQEVFNKHLLSGGADKLRRFFALIKQRQQTQPVKLDLSMLEISGRLLTGLYLPGANLEGLVITESDLTGSNLSGANLKAVVGNGAIMRGVIATGADFTDAVFPKADFSGARLIGTTLINTYMQEVIVDKDTNLVGARLIGTFLGDNQDLINITNHPGAIIRGIR